MNFSALFGFGKQPPQLPIAHGNTTAQLPIAPDSSADLQSETGPIGTHRELSGAIGSKIEVPQITWFLPTQAAWLNDHWHLRIWEKSRQVGAI